METESNIVTALTNTESINLYLSEVEDIQGEEVEMPVEPETTQRKIKKRASGAAIRKKRRDRANNANPRLTEIAQHTPKRNIQATSPEEASANRQKRVRPDGLAYRDAVVSFPMAIAPIDYPKSVVYGELLEILKKFIVRAIDRIPASDPGPAFVNLKLHDGAVIVSCLNKETAEWLTKTIVEYGENGLKLQCVSLEKLPRVPTYRLWIPDEEIPFEKAMDRLQKQNWPLNTTQWRLLHSKRMNSGQLMVVQTEGECVSWISKNGRKLFFGLSKGADIHPVKGENPATVAATENGEQS